MYGECIWFSAARGFGFLKSADGGKDIFCHFSAIVGDGFRTLEQGQAVEFELAQGPKGSQAANVRVLDESEAMRMRAEEEVQRG